MFVSVTKIGNEFSISLIAPTKEEWEEQIDKETEMIIFHEEAFPTETYSTGEEKYNAGENVIEAIASTAGDDDSPGSALERLLTKVFVLGLTHGSKSERDRIIDRVTGE